MATWGGKMRMFSVKNSTRRKPRNSKPLTFVIKDRGIVVVCGVKLHPQIGRWLPSRLPRVWFPSGRFISLSGVPGLWCVTQSAGEPFVRARCVLRTPSLRALWEMAGTGLGRLAHVEETRRASCGFPPSAAQQTVLH